MSQFIEMFKGDNQVPLGDICNIEKGATITRNDVLHGEVPVVAGGQEPSCYHNVANREAGAITVSASGAYAGYINFWNCPIFASDCNTIISKDDEKTDQTFVYFGLRAMQKQIYGLQKGGAQPHVYGKDLQKFMFPCPSYAKQIEFSKMAKQADKSEFVGCKSQFIEMFGNQNTNDKGWTESLVKDEFKLSMGKTPARNNPECWDNGTHKWVSISDMSSYTRYTGDTSEYITDYAIADSGIKAVPKGTIIMSFKLSIGRTAITSEDLYTNEAIMAFAGFDEKKFNIDFLHFLIANKNWLLGAKQAVKGQTLNKESIGNAKIIIPPIEAQEEFASIYNQADKSEFELRKSIEAIDQVIKSLINN